MTNKINNNFLDQDNSNQTNIREIIENYLIHWKWILISVFLFLLTAFLYIRYSTPIYKATSLVMLKDDRKGGALNELAAFSDIGLLSGAKNNVDNEIEVLKSRTLAENTIKKLGLDIQYYSDARIKSFELYDESPVIVTFLEKYKPYDELVFSFTVNVISSTKFSVNSPTEGNIGEFNFGEVVTSEFGKFIVNKSTSKYKVDSHKLTQIIVNPISKLSLSLSKSISVEPLSKNTSVISVSLTSLSKRKAEDYINTLIELYNEDAIRDRKYISENTSKFIIDRLEIIQKELGIVEDDYEKFKKENNVVDISTQANIYLNNLADFDKKITETQVKISIIDAVIDSFSNKNVSTDIIPVDILPAEANANGLISELNKAILNRSKLSQSAGAESAVMKQSDADINAIKASLKESLLRTKNNLQISLRDLSGQKSVLGSNLAKVPSLEKNAKIIGRQQGIKEALYLYLLEKREETEITMAAIAPNAKVIDTALALDTPVSPKKNIIYLVALVLGLMFPIAVIYILELLDTKVRDRFDVENLVGAPFIGDVPHSDSNEEIMNANSRSSSAEALRIIRTNMEFMLAKVPDGIAKTIFVTSTLPKEGKTFISINLAATFALSGKKVLLIGMDIRNPKFDDYFNLPIKHGVTSYLSSSMSLDQVMVKQDGYESFYVIAPGLIPPNPAELLMGKKVEEMFKRFKYEFDYIIVDTAPVSLVTDTILISKYADSFVYVVRQNYLDRRMLKIPYLFYKENKLPNMSMLLNDSTIKRNYGYGYGYGYGVEIEEEPWYKKILNKFKK